MLVGLSRFLSHSLCSLTHRTNKNTKKTLSTLIVRFLSNLCKYSWLFLRSWIEIITHTRIVLTVYGEPIVLIFYAVLTTISLVFSLQSDIIIIFLAYLFCCRRLGLGVTRTHTIIKTTQNTQKFSETDSIRVCMKYLYLIRWQTKHML